jgi:hypothetical protein
MSIKIYQPERKDLLINTAWGIPREQMAESEAEARGLTLFHDHWIAKGEKQQLRDEAHAYSSLRVLANLLLFLSFLTVVWTIQALQSYGAAGLLVLVPGAACLAGGMGLRRYALWGRNLAAALFGTMLILPFIPAGSDDKGGPLFFFIGGLGLYYLFRRTAGKIFRGGT